MDFVIFLILLENIGGVTFYGPVISFKSL